MLWAAALEGVPLLALAQLRRCELYLSFFNPFGRICRAFFPTLELLFLLERLGCSFRSTVAEVFPFSDESKGVVVCFLAPWRSSIVLNVRISGSPTLPSSPLRLLLVLGEL